MTRAPSPISHAIAKKRRKLLCAPTLSPASIRRAALQRLVVLGENLPRLRFHEAERRILPGAGQRAHPGAGDEIKVALPGRIEEGHLRDGLVVRGHAEW